jgi:hypothetical protein
LPSPFTPVIGPGLLPGGQHRGDLIGGQAVEVHVLVPCLDREASAGGGELGVQLLDCLPQGDQFPACLIGGCQLAGTDEAGWVAIGSLLVGAVDQYRAGNPARRTARR